MVRAIIRVDHEGTQAAAAKSLGVTKSGLGQFLSGVSGYGEKLREGLEKYLRVPFDDIVAANGDLEGLRAGKREPSGHESVEVQFGKLPSWDALLAGAKALDPTLPAWCWAEVERARVWVSQPVTSSMVVDLGRFVLKHVPPPPHA